MALQTSRDRYPIFAVASRLRGHRRNCGGYRCCFAVGGFSAGAALVGAIDGYEAAASAANRIAKEEEAGIIIGEQQVSTSIRGGGNVSANAESRCIGQDESLRT